MVQRINPRNFRNVLMASPGHFDVAVPTNAHTNAHVGRVDRVAAKHQWLALNSAYKKVLGRHAVHTIMSPAGLQDFVFAANQSFPLPVTDANDRPVVLMSRMALPVRKSEVEYYREWYVEHGFVPAELPKDVPSFEGMGDALWFDDTLLLGGVGPRTHASAYAYVQGLVAGVSVLLFELQDPLFYHLDTCLSILSERTALYYPGAFTDRGREDLQNVFQNLIEVTESDARNFACNCHSPDGEHVIIQRASFDTNRTLNFAGFQVLEVETGEFMKAGGSVFCMKMMIPDF